jgi:hypothetical protein
MFQGSSKTSNQYDPSVNKISSVETIIYEHSFDKSINDTKYELFESILQKRIGSLNSLPINKSYTKRKLINDDEKSIHISNTVDTISFDSVDTIMHNVMLYGSPDNWPPNKQMTDSYNELMDEYMKSIFNQKRNENLYETFTSGIIKNIKDNIHNFTIIIKDTQKDAIQSITLFSKEELLNYFWKGASVAFGIFVAFWVVPAISLPLPFLTSIFTKFIPSFKLDQLPELIGHLKTQGINIGIKVYGLINDFKEMQNKFGTIEAFKDLLTEALKYTVELVFIGYIQYNFQPIIDSIKTFLPDMRIPDIMPTINIPFLTGIGLTEQYIKNIPARMLSTIITNSLRSKLNYLLPQTAAKIQLLEERTESERDKKAEDEAEKALRIELDGPGFKDIVYENTITRWENFKKAHTTISNILSIIFVSFLIEWFIGVYATNIVNDVVDIKQEPGKMYSFFESIVIGTNSKSIIGNITSIANNYLHMSYAMPIITKAFNEIAPFPENVTEYLTRKLKYNPNKIRDFHSHYTYLELCKNIFAWFTNILAGGIIQFTNMLFNIFRQDLAQFFSKIAEFTINNAEKIQSNVKSGIYSIYDPIKQFYDNIQLLFSSIGKPNDDDDDKLFSKIDSINNNPDLDNETKINRITDEIKSINAKINVLDTVNNPEHVILHSKLTYHHTILTNAKLALLQGNPASNNNSSSASSASNNVNYFNSVINTLMGPIEYFKSIAHFSAEKTPDNSSIIKVVRDSDLPNLTGIRVYNKNDLRVLKTQIQTNQKELNAKQQDESVKKTPLLATQLESLDNEYNKLIRMLDTAIRSNVSTDIHFVIEKSTIPINDDFSKTYTHILKDVLDDVKIKTVNIKAKLDSVNTDIQQTDTDIENEKKNLMSIIDVSKYMSEAMKDEYRKKVDKWAANASKYKPDMNKGSISFHINNIDEKSAEIEVYDALYDTSKISKPPFIWGEKPSNEQSPINSNIVLNPEQITAFEKALLNMNTVIDGTTVFLGSNIKPPTAVAPLSTLDVIKTDIHLRQTVIDNITTRATGIANKDSMNKLKLKHLSTIEELNSVSTADLLKIQKDMLPIIEKMIANAEKINGRLAELNSGTFTASINCGKSMCDQYVDNQIYQSINDAIGIDTINVDTAIKTLYDAEKRTNKDSNELLDKLERRFTIAGKFITSAAITDSNIWDYQELIKLKIINSVDIAKSETQFIGDFQQKFMTILTNLPQFERRMKELDDKAEKLKDDVSKITDGHTIFENTKLTVNWVQLGSNKEQLTLDKQTILLNDIDTKMKSIVESMMTDFVGQVISTNKYDNNNESDKSKSILAGLGTEIDDDKAKLKTKNEELSKIFIDTMNTSNKAFKSAKANTEINSRSQLNAMNVKDDTYLKPLDEKKRNDIIDDYQIPNCPPGLDPRLFFYNQKQVGILASKLSNNIAFNQFNKQELRKLLETKHAHELQLTVQTKLLQLHNDVLNSMGNTPETIDSVKWVHNCIMGTSVGDACKMDPLRNDYQSIIDKANVSVMTAAAEVSASAAALLAQGVGAVMGPGTVGASFVAGAGVASTISNVAAITSSVSNFAASYAAPIHYISSIFRKDAQRQDASATIGRFDNSKIGETPQDDKYSKQDYSFTAEHVSILNLFTTMNTRTDSSTKENPIKQGFDMTEKTIKEHFDNVRAGKADYWDPGEIAYTQFYNLKLQPIDIKSPLRIVENMTTLGRSFMNILGEQSNNLARIISLKEKYDNKETGFWDATKQRIFGSVVSTYKTFLGEDTRTTKQQSQYAKWEKDGWFSWGLTKLYRTSDVARNLVKNQVLNQWDPENNISKESMKMLAMGTEMLTILKDIPNFSVYNQLNNIIIRELNVIGKTENSIGITKNDGMAFKMMMSGKATAIIENQLFDTLVDEHQYGFLKGMSVQGNKSVKTLMNILHNQGIYYAKGIADQPNSSIINKIIDDNYDAIYGNFLDRQYQHATLAVACDKENIYDTRNTLSRLYDEQTSNLYTGIGNIASTAATSWLTSQSNNALKSAQLLANSGKWVRQAGKGGRLVRSTVEISNFLKIIPKIIKETNRAGNIISKFGIKNTKNVVKSFYNNGLNHGSKTKKP